LSGGIKRDLQRVVAGLVAALDLPQAYMSPALEHYVPVVDWLFHEMKEHASSTYVLGIHGAQGTGKTTLAELFRRYFQNERQRSVVSVSIDDFYRTRQDRQELAARVHPLLATRGPPGTHDIDLALETLQRIRTLTAGESIKLPRFDKAADDRVPASKWSTICGPVDLVILEGWCIGSEPAEPDSLRKPVNALEKNEDEDGTWRRFVNDSLMSYQPLFELIDGLLMLRTPSFETVLEWRIEQERKLRQSSPKNTNRIMTETDIRRFVQFFERLTVAADATVTAKADVIIHLGPDHQPFSVDINS
jgi:D-glycerate 3-kinase